ncbi:MAG: NAD+ synthase [Candidatus Schekmanbacteria bacterium]|nr:NAD+ synthase [Candidatus Schekmanbacteria bacterium]
MRCLRLALAQINCTMGDMTGNAHKIRQYIQAAKNQQVDIIAFPELAVSGYPPEDLLFKPDFIQRNLQALDQIKTDTAGITAVVGFIDNGQEIYNSAALLSDGQFKAAYHKICLPNYGVFDEKRYFKEGESILVTVMRGIRVGICICEDIWSIEGPICSLVNDGGAEIILVVNASPYHMGKWKLRQEIIKRQAIEHQVVVAYCNQVGAQDELIYDGHSLVYDQNGEMLAQGWQFEEDLVVLDLALPDKVKARTVCRHHNCQAYPLETIEISSAVAKSAALTKEAIRPLLHPLEEVYQALLSGIRDYTRKNNFSKVLVGLSGGIDSALTVVLAVDALGKDNVKAVFMPSSYSSAASRADSHQLAENLGIELWDLPIQTIFASYLTNLAPLFAGLPPNSAEENIQARIRGNFLMALSNKFGWLVLTTGNKSEMSVGYATLYGDMAGGFAVLKDVFKRLVYQLAEYRNLSAPTPIIPRRIIDREPSAELRENQKDSDSLPPYPVLDPILCAYVEEEKGLEEIVGMGYPQDTVKRVIDLVDRSEYKRRQAPIGIRITPKAFGRDRRLPITNRFKY